MSIKYTRKEMVEKTLIVYTITGKKDITIDIMLKLFGNYYFSVICTTINMFESLVESIRKAGGSDFIYNEWSEISLVDLITKLCTNRIRFTTIEKNNLYED